MRFSNDGIFDTETFEVYGASKAWTLLGPRWHQHRVGAVSGQRRVTWPSSPTRIHARTAGPAGTVTIDNNAPYTTSPNVTLNSDVTGATEMRFSNDGVFDTETFEPYSATKSWTLAGADGPKTVYAEYRDAAANVLATSDAITLDTTGPTGSILRSTLVRPTPSPRPSCSRSRQPKPHRCSSPTTGPPGTRRSPTLPRMPTRYRELTVSRPSTSATSIRPATPARRQAARFRLDATIDQTLFLSAPGDVVRNARFTVSGSLKPLAAAGRNIVVTAYLNGVPDAVGHGGQGRLSQSDHRRGLHAVLGTHGSADEGAG